MTYSYSAQITAIQEARNICKKYFNDAYSDMDLALKDAGSTIAALNLSDPYKEIERLNNELRRQEKHLAHYADVNQNQ